MFNQYISSDMHYFVLLLEITIIQMLLFFTVLNSKYETKEKCHYFKTSKFRAIYFSSVNLILNSLLFSQRETMILFDENQ